MPSVQEELDQGDLRANKIYLNLKPRRARDVRHSIDGEEELPRDRRGVQDPDGHGAQQHGPLQGNRVAQGAVRKCVAKRGRGRRLTEEAWRRRRFLQQRPRWPAQET